jgi:hydrogenase maturation factor
VNLPKCDHEVGCITCGDTAVEMTVLAIDRDRGLALCANREGDEQTVEIALVGAVTEGDALLVHAGTALQKLVAA